MDTFEAYILQATYSIREAVAGADESAYPEVQLYGRTKDGRSIVMTTREFLPYFFADDREKAQRFLSGREEVVKTEGMTLETTGQEERRVLKVWTRIPPDVRELRTELERLDIGVYAADIMFGMRFMYDNDLGPFVKLEGDFTDDEQYHFKMSSIQNTDPFPPPFVVLSLDIEASPKDGHIHCICWALRLPDGGGTSGRIHNAENDDARIIRDLLDFIRSVDPDVILGHYLKGYDLPKLLERANLFGIKLRMGRDGSTIKPRYDRKTGNINEWSCHGRAIVDTLDVTRKEKYYGSQGRFTQSPHEDLDTVVFELGWGGDPKVIDASQVDAEWAKDYERVLAYCQLDAEKALFILEKFEAMQKAVTLAEVTHNPIERCIVPKQSWLWDPLLIPAADKAGFLVPCNTYGEDDDDDDDDKISGAYVADPVPGLHEWVCAVDYASTYPSAIMANNICFTTYTSRTANVTVTPFLEKCKTYAHYLKKEDREGILPHILRDMKETRKWAKAEYKRTGEMYYERLNRAVKVLMNALYGILSSSFYRFTNKAIGESITTFARTTLENLVSKLKNEGIMIIQGDTDAAYLLSPARRVQDAVAWGQRIAKENSTESVDLDLERVFETHFNHGRKKRYAGNVVWPEAYFYARGYEMRRGDSFEYLRTLVENLLREILAKEPDRACKNARDRIKAVRSGQVENGLLVIIKSCRDEKEYKHPDRMAQVKAARKLKERGYPFVAGMKVSYIVTDGDTPQEVEPYIEGELVVPDFEYYTKRLLDAVEDIVRVFNFDRESLLRENRPSTLLEWC